jgi:hypothetical protein
MMEMDDQPDPVRSVLALVLVMLAAIALLVGVGVAVARVAPDIGEDDIVEPDDSTRSYPDAAALMTAAGCTDAHAVAAFAKKGTVIRSYAQPTASSCATDGMLGLVYVDADDRYTAEDDGDVADRVCAELEITASATATTTTAVTADSTVAPSETTTALPATTTVAPTTTTIAETVFGMVRGPNWILATPDGERGATALQGRLGGVAFSTTCEPPEE